MLRRHQAFFSRFYMGLDSVILIVAFILAWAVRFKTTLLPQYPALSFDNYLILLLISLPAYHFFAALFGLYETMRTSRLRFIGYQIIKSMIAMTLIEMSVAYFDKQFLFSRAVILFYGLFGSFFLFLGRYSVRRGLERLRSRGYNLKYVVFVGVTASTVTFVERLLKHTELGYQVLGYILEDHLAKDLDKNIQTQGTPKQIFSNDSFEPMDPLSERELAAAGVSVSRRSVVRGKARIAEVNRLRGWMEQLSTKSVPFLGYLRDLDHILSTQIIDHLIVTLPDEADRGLSEVLAIASSHGIHVILVPQFLELLPSRPKFDEFAGIPIVDTHYTPLDEMANALLKRVFDLAFAILVLVLGAPLFALIALLVKLSSPGPVFFSQERVGLNRRTFRMYKFRTMYVDSEGTEQHKWTVPDDPRRTPIGKFLRRTSLDEFPQFYNVLRGDMSVIGPRPERPFFVHHFRQDIPKYMLKHRVRPGITGWAQVHGLRGDTSIEERIEYDLQYIEDWTFGMDIRIVLLTLFKGMNNRNAY